MLLFHRTDEPNKILAEGFRSSTDRRPTGEELHGVWLSRRPLHEEECGSTWLLAVEVPDDVARRYEVDDGKEDYTEYCIPADVLNELAPPALVV